jgi:hypothetical protein
MRFFLLMFMLVLNFVLPCLKLLAFTFLFEILEIFLSLLLVPHIKVVPLLDLHQPQIPFAKILIYLVNNWLHLIVF